MAKTWYPVIDYLTCVECGACVAKCTHGVYDLLKAPIPVVMKPEACIDHCHGCGNRCPVGAITYVGDDTGWIPSCGNEKLEEPCCSYRNDDSSSRTILVEYLYLDLQSCDRCIGTDKVLEEVLTTLTPALQLAGYEVEYNRIEIETATKAIQYQFVS
jgi:NAD-dependent dihydropyrimidine dehydrogenase PreA subunit